MTSFFVIRYFSARNFSDLKKFDWKKILEVSCETTKNKFQSILHNNNILTSQLEDLKCAIEKNTIKSVHKEDLSDADQRLAAIEAKIEEFNKNIENFLPNNTAELQQIEKEEAEFLDKAKDLASEASKQNESIIQLLGRIKTVNKNPINFTREDEIFILPEIEDDLADRVARNDFSILGMDKDEFEKIETSEKH